MGAVPMRVRSEPLLMIRLSEKRGWLNCCQPLLRFAPYNVRRSEIRSCSCSSGRFKMKGRSSKPRKRRSYERLKKITPISFPAYAFSLILLKTN